VGDLDRGHPVQGDEHGVGGLVRLAVAATPYGDGHVVGGGEAHRGLHVRDACRADDHGRESGASRLKVAHSAA
jgi:hypothetical protein